MYMGILYMYCTYNVHVHVLKHVFKSFCLSFQKKKKTSSSKPVSEPVAPPTFTSVPPTTMPSAPPSSLYGPIYADLDFVRYTCTVHVRVHVDFSFLCLRKCNKFWDDFRTNLWAIYSLCFLKMASF